MAGTPVVTASRGRLLFAVAVLVGVAVAAALGVYARLHQASRRALFTLGFPGVLEMKTWLATIAVMFAVLQLITALWMWGRLPGAGPARSWVPTAHRWSGTVAFLLSLPVVLHCVWSIGFGQHGARLIIHSFVGCIFYGAFAAKMVGLRLRGLPGWALPVLGGVTFTAYVITWVTSALWFFTLRPPGY
jgi:hypothetical protein